MRKALYLAGMLVLALAVAVVAAEPSRLELKVGDKPYVCGCGAACPCDSMANRAGKCTCGKDMVQATVTEVGDGVVKVEGAQKAEFKTVGKFACACGPACACGSISQNPGKCTCGKDMAAVN